MADVPILIPDEVISSLGSESEKAIQQAIERLMVGRLRMRERLVRLYSQRCRQIVEAVARTLDRDHFMNAEGALAWQLVNQVYEPRAVEASP